ncbi:MAG: hypothetical protein U0M12_09535 [Acutalibacteraceae bacterium]|nr:hypothetical protein [Acutalibacteraceae bacterium]
MSDNKNIDKTKKELTEEQRKENQKKIDEYDRILKVTVVSLALMFGIIVCIVVALVINNT